jgi:hypothetical protein
MQSIPSFPVRLARSRESSFVASGAAWRARLDSIELTCRSAVSVGLSPGQCLQAYSREIIDYYARGAMPKKNKLTYLSPSQWLAHEKSHSWYQGLYRTVPSLQIRCHGVLFDDQMLSLVKRRGFASMIRYRTLQCRTPNCCRRARRQGRRDASGCQYLEVEAVRIPVRTGRA